MVRLFWIPTSSSWHRVAEKTIMAKICFEALRQESSSEEGEGWLTVTISKK
jgi:hypothetical protein